MCSSPLIISVAPPLQWVCFSNKSSWTQYGSWCSHKDWVERDCDLPCPAGHTYLDAAQDTSDFLSSKYMLLSSCQVFHPLVTKSSAELLSTHLFLVCTCTQVQDFVLGLLELHEVHTGPSLKPCSQVPLDGIPSLWKDYTTQLAVPCKLEGALNPTVHKKILKSTGPCMNLLRNTPNYWSSILIWAVDCYSLRAVIPLIPCSSNNLSIKWMSFQFRDKAVMWV